MSSGPSTHQDSPIERFNVGPDPEHPGFSEMHPAHEGHWVRYSDHRSLIERLAGALEQIADPIKDQRSRMHPDGKTDAELAAIALAGTSSLVRGDTDA